MNAKNKNDPQILCIGTTYSGELLHAITQKLSFVVQNQCIPEVIDEKYFTDGSPNVRIKNQLQGKIVIFVLDMFSKRRQVEGKSVNDAFMSAKAMIKTARNAGVRNMHAVIPSMPYARDDIFEEMGMESMPQQKSNMFSLVLEEFAYLGLQSVLTVDIHNAGVYTSMRGLDTKQIGIGRALKEILAREQIDLQNLVLSGCDDGATKKIQALAKGLGTDYLHVIKHKNYAKDQSVEHIDVYGDANKKTVIVYDDMIDTGSTYCKTLQEIAKRNPTRIIGYVSHFICTGNALEQLTTLYDAGILEKLYITNTVPHISLPGFIHTLDVSDHLVRALGEVVNV